MAFKNWQWTVTEKGVVANEGARSGTIKGITPWYEFNAERLTEKTTRKNNVEFYDWPLHVAQKTWVDIEAFNEAFVEALKIHAGKYPGKVDREMLQASLEEARRIAADR